ncbi:hypothetical protein F1D05_13545 [Kribbella qitaiheensis]|uniref:DUF3800 domain-containing protein n=1 Tax=Kribbella qitaiheensis TaxID=1544730 RepID=A0A7G6WXM7_9ACTN|nr:hypothetical protein [Kribbella qitaiheensis]QNE18742.1 hypothetical protein F1D05_13545 [Kribbella qitaiheensis]
MRYVEIACDESGFSGSNLLDPSTPVITHAAVDLGVAEAVELVARVRANSRHPNSEYKSTQMLRRRSAVECLLESLEGRASVHLTDKRFFVVNRMVDFLLGEPTYAAGTSLAVDLRGVALRLHREGPEVFGTANWYAVLTSFAAMMRTKRHRVVNRPAVDRYYEALRRARGGHEVIELLCGTRARAEEVFTTLLDERSSVPPPLEPLLTALVDTTLHWSAGGRVVDIIHDEQSALTPHRVNQIRILLAEARVKAGVSAAVVEAGVDAAEEVAGGEAASARGLLREPVLEVRVAPARPLRGFGLVDSRGDARVQVADLLAGVGRHLATEELRGRGDPGLTGLLRAYVVEGSLWADEGSGRRLSLGGQV